jgi:hypothetical protein
VTLESHTGTRYEAKASNRVLELYGMSIATVNDKFEIEELEVYFDPADSVTQIFDKKNEGSGCPLASGVQDLNIE